MPRCRPADLPTWPPDHLATCERGFALLLVFLMAASIAIMMYMELPRQSFERQRDKEQLLIDRGEQYRQAIRIYYRKFKQYPATLEALDETNGVHFLRHKYKDPMTGKDEWRLIHVGPGGVFTDSKTQAPPDPNKDSNKDKGPSTFITEAPTIGGSNQTQGATTPSYRRERGGMYSGAPPYPGSGQQPVTDPNNPQAGVQQPYPGGIPVQTPYGQQQLPNPYNQTPYGGPPMPGYGQQQQPGAPWQQPGQIGGGIQQPGMPYQPYPTQGMQPGQQYPQPGMPYQPYPAPGMPGTTPDLSGQYPQQYPQQAVYPPLPANSQQGGVSNPYSTQPGVGGAPGMGAVPISQPGAGPTPFGGNQSNAATSMIMNLLTTPKPGGLAGVQNQSGFGTITGGIAGIASKLEVDSIKVYNDEESYDMWEFLYDPRKDTGTAGGTGMAGANPQTGAAGQQQLGPGQNQNPFSPPGGSGATGRPIPQR